MHDVFGVHFFEALQDAVDDGAGLEGIELVLGLDFVVELSSLQQLDYDVE